MQLELQEMGGVITVATGNTLCTSPYFVRECQDDASCGLLLFFFRDLAPSLRSWLNPVGKLAVGRRQQRLVQPPRPSTAPLPACSACLRWRWRCS